MAFLLSVGGPLCAVYFLLYEFSWLGCSQLAAALMLLGLAVTLTAAGLLALVLTLGIERRRPAEEQDGED